MSDQIRIDDEYKRWIQQISSDFRKSQIKAASTVNSEMLKFYWRLGEGIEQEKQKYSSTIIDCFLPLKFRNKLLQFLKELKFCNKLLHNYPRYSVSRGDIS